MVDTQTIQYLLATNEDRFPRRVRESDCGNTFVIDGAGSTADPTPPGGGLLEQYHSVKSTAQGSDLFFKEYSDTGSETGSQRWEKELQAADQSRRAFSRGQRLFPDYRRLAALEPPALRWAPPTQKDLPEIMTLPTRRPGQREIEHRARVLHARRQSFTRAYEKAEKRQSLYPVERLVAAQTRAQSAPGGSRKKAGRASRSNPSEDSSGSDSSRPSTAPLASRLSASGSDPRSEGGRSTEDYQPPTLGKSDFLGPTQGANYRDPETFRNPYLQNPYFQEQQAPKTPFGKAMQERKLRDTPGKQISSGPFIIAVTKGSRRNS
jgi:hypothetical protein